MQVKQIFIAGLLAVITFTSCSKKNDGINVKQDVPIEGNWEGKYSILSEPFNNYYSFTFKAGGVLELKNALNQKTGQGTWHLQITTLLLPARIRFCPHQLPLSLSLQALIK